MQKTIDAIFENGVFRPTQSVTDVPEHARAVVTLVPTPPPWADCVGTLPDEDAREMTRIIDAEFETVDPNDW